MKILIVTQYFYPENFRINNLVLELKNRGHKITVLTGLPNYPRGEYFNGYSTEKNCDEIWENIKIYRCKLKARHSGSINLIRNYFSFVRQGKKKLKDIKEDFDLIYVFEVSPITVALPAIKMKKIRKIPLIMNVQDLWPENIIAVTGMKNQIVINIIKLLVKHIYKNCDLVLTASKSFVPNIQSYLKHKKDKVRFWPQYANDVRIESIKEKNESFNIVFTGNIGEAQGIDMVIEAANKLKKEKVIFNFYGNGRSEEKLKNLVNEYELNDKVFFNGFKPAIEIPKYLATADAALLILKPDPVFEMTIPAKLQTYMACGIPILGCVSGEGKKVIEEARAGLVSDEISVEALVNKIKEYLSLSEKELQVFRKNSYEYGLQNFNKNKLLIELEKYMEALL